MAKYKVSISFGGCYEVEVEASNEEEAEDRAIYTLPSFENITEIGDINVKEIK